MVMRFLEIEKKIEIDVTCKSFDNIICKKQIGEGNN